MSSRSRERIPTKIFTWTIENFSKLTEPTGVYKFRPGGHKWRLLFYPKGGVVHDHLSVTICRRLLFYPKEADYSFTLINQLHGGTTSFVKKKGCLISLLAEFKETVPSSLSTIEISGAQMTKDFDERLAYRKGQLTSLEADVSRLSEECSKLEAEIQQLSPCKSNILEHLRPNLRRRTKRLPGNLMNRRNIIPRGRTLVKSG
ncbi:MATH domain and coiled-coil domain-containing protein At3g27040 [Linum grandiflorum]